eukprot:m.65639 g.65639  ORF g.65639 m.65639 type:complete len:293 (+) comp7344_c0_seq1:2602-3480(+)
MLSLHRAGPALARVRTLSRSSLRVSDPIRSRFALPEHHLSYTDHGPKDSEKVIVAFHGCPGSAFDWRYIGAILEPKCRFIRLELPGHGETPLALCPDPSPDAINEHVHKVVRHLVLPGQQLWLLGHSLGSQVALHYAAKHVAAVSGVAILATAANMRPHRGIRPWGVITRLVHLASNPTVQPVIQPLARTVMTKIHGFSTRFAAEEFVHSWRRTTSLNFETHKRIAARLHKHNVPVMVAWTRDDHLIEHEIAQETANTFPPGPRLCFPTGGHHLVKTRAAEIAAALEDWMKL